MQLKYVIPNMEKTFGILEYAGEGEVVTRRINNRSTVISRSFNLYSSIQRADEIVVTLPAEAEEKHFEPDERVILVNPKITAGAIKIDDRGFSDYILTADNMIKAPKEKDGK